jgi:hypothetical protein
LVSFYKNEVITIAFDHLVPLQGACFENSPMLFRPISYIRDTYKTVE